MSPERHAIDKDAATFLQRSDQLMLIDGQWEAAQNKQWIDTYNPATGEKLGRFPDGQAADIDQAVAAARRAFRSGTWAQFTPSDRSRLLYSIADTIAKHSDELACLETIDQGKPLGHARSEMVGVVGQYRYFSGLATKIQGETFAQSMNRHNPAGKKTLAYSVKEPIGVVGAIVPWNAPLILLAFKLAPALAAGCTVVVKPAEQTSLSTIRFGELLLEAGVPPGVVNIVTGTGANAGAALSEHPDVDKISFTGSTLTGRKIVAASQGNLKKVSLELGGKSPAIFLKDADLQESITGAVRAITYNSGQICIAGSRLYAHKSIYDDLIEGIVERFRALNVGDGMICGTDVGPMVNRMQADKVKAYIDGAESDGAEVLVGGGQFGDTRCFIEPTVLVKTNNRMRCVQEEIFGPVLCCQSFDNDDDIADLANDTIYGLGASVWTRDLSQAHNLAHEIKAGVVWINGHNIFDPAFPMGGYKQSGWSRDSGAQAIDNFMETKTVIALI